MAPTTKQLVSYSTIAVITSLLAYAAYFDYKRRSDATFRKKLRKAQKRVANSSKSSATSDPSKAAAPASYEELRAALNEIKSEPLPESLDEREKYFFKQLEIGEKLVEGGPASEFSAALHFYRALRVYPTPVELLGVFQKTTPPSLFKLIVEMTQVDLREKIEGYYEYFPPPSLNVAVKHVPVRVGPDGTTPKKSVLVASKDFEAGEQIFVEQHIIAALDLDLEGKATHCSECLCKITGAPVTLSNDPLRSVYCSDTCQMRAKLNHHNLLFGLDPPLPVETPATPADLAARRDAQTAFAKYIKENGNLSPLLLARFTARSVDEETYKMLPPQLAPPRLPSDLPEPVGAGDIEYTHADHIERLRFLEVTPGLAGEEEIKHLRDILRTAMNGLEEFVDEHRFFVHKGKVLYNAIGVVIEDDRVNTSIKDKALEDVERTRTPHGISRQTGAAVYRVASYLGHSCTPNTKPTFPKGNSELHLIATRPIKVGDQLTMAYVDIDTPEGADMAEGRRIRRQELARGWRFACECSRCVEESAIVAAAAATATLEEKEKVEDLSGDVPPPLEDVPAEEVEVAVPENAEVDQEAIEEKTLGEASEEKSGGGLAGADTPMTWSVISENQPHDDEPAAAVVEQPVVSDEKLAEEWPVVGHEPEHPKEEEEYDGPIIAE